MEKKDITALLLSAALAGGVFYYLFFTERGQQWLEKMKDAAADKIDDMLAMIERELAELQEKAMAEN